jgi:heat-inducible transcriptional repressor
LVEDRRRRVLHLVVEAFVATNRPVASRDLAEPLGVSSATVRNDLAALEELGLLHQPHTSAGRVPTRDAYRSYALRFLPPQPLSESWRERLNTAIDRSEGEARLRVAARIAASLSGYATATVVAPREAPLEAMFLSPLPDGRVLVVVILRGGVVRELTVDAGFRVERATLERLEEALRGAPAALGEVPGRLRHLEETGSPAVSRLARALRERWGEVAPNVVFSEGTAQVLGEPESQDVSFLRGVLELLEHPPAPAGPPGEVSVAVDDPKGISAVTVGFRSGAGRGSVVIVGPTRMRYPQAISVAKAVSDALND